MKSISSAIAALAGAVLVAAAVVSGSYVLMLALMLAGGFVGGLGFVLWLHYIFRE